MIERAIHSRLTNFGGLAALLGAKIYGVTLPPEMVAPVMTFRRVQSRPVYHQSGYSGLCFATFVFDIFASGYDEAKQIAGALDDALGGFSGTVESVAILGSVKVGEFDQFESDPEFFRVTCEYEIQFQE